MRMPKAAVNKNDLAMLWQDNIRISWKILPVEPIPKADMVQIFPNQQLGPGICLSYAGHDPASGSLAINIWHA